MIRLLSFAALVAIAVAVAVWFADRPGQVSVEWLGWRVETTMPVLLLALALLAGLLTQGWRLAGGLLSAPGRWSEGRRQKRRHKGYQALTDGLAAVAAGDVAQVRHWAGRAEKLLDDPVLTRFLSAKAAQLEGDGQAARSHFEAMLERPESAALGVRGLLDEALKAKDIDGAIEHARKARQFAPGDKALAETLFGLLVRKQRLDEAMGLIGAAERSKALSRSEGSRRRALLLTAMAGNAVTAGQPAQAADLAKRALAHDPAMTAAALILAEVHRRSGKQRAAMAVLAKAWSQRPMPALAEAGLGLVPGDEPLARLRRLEKLTAGRPNDPESHLALGAAALEARIWGQARKHLETAAEARPSARVFGLLARLEESGYNDPAAARAWRERIAGAPPDPAWQCRRCSGHAPAWSLECPHCGAVEGLEWE